MSWMSEATAFCAALTILFAPGAVVGWTVGLRGLPLYASAPALSVSLVASAAVLSPYAGLEWSVWSVVAATILTGVLFLLAQKSRWWTLKKVAAEYCLTQSVAVCGALAIAGVLVAGRMIAAISDPAAISQTFDNVFHMNAVQFIQDQGSGSSLTVGEMTGGAFYPAAWHDLVSILVEVSGASIPVGANVLNVCIGALVWPTGCVYLAQTVVGRRPEAVVSAGVISAAFGAYPLLMVDFGVLYPNFLALSVLPVLLALAIRTLKLGCDETATPGLAGIAFLGALPGLALAHPSGLMTLIPLLAPAGVIWWWQWNSRNASHAFFWSSRLSRILMLAAAGAVCFALWKLVRPPEAAATWPPVLSAPAAIWNIVSSSGIARPESWVVMVCTLLGLVFAVITKRYWLLGAYLALTVLFFMAVAGQPGRIRTFLVGVWYNDPQRLAAALPVVILPVAVLGAVGSWDFFSRRFAKVRTTAESSAGAKLSGQTGVTATAVITVLLLVWGTQQQNLAAAEASARHNYALTGDSALLDTAEMGLLNRIRDEVPKGSVIVGNPWNGSSLVYAIAQRRTLQPHVLGAVSDDAREVFSNLNKAGVSPAVCSSVHRLNADYVLDFGNREVNNGEGRTIDYDGLSNLKANGVADVVDSQGSATLYRITACGE
ncbi:DUF6541 family protein [Arthrobacter sp. UYCo732]|uniref:DUF6541 family protein n=2 Tax=unclassified Arthrobacter TaxID=235627 RepID=UPI0033922AE6